ncbi:MAG: methyltransferase domain-containing protein [Candidatus Omnitrophica bacterium]|nr:methyltransferase domain-containing protein [Candidatus Omnitrophota bacterium]
MYSNQDSIDMFNQMVTMGSYYGSGRPVPVAPEVIIEDICSKIPLLKSDVLLDVGCGTGVVTIPLSKRCKSIYALDAAEKVLEMAKQRCRQENVTNVAYYQGSALHLPFEDNSFDHVLMYAVIHYLENEQQVYQCVGELVRVCKAGGRVLITEIPDECVRHEFDQRTKTPQEQQILDAFQSNRGEYDRLFKEYVKKFPNPNSLVLDCERIVKEGVRLGCEGNVCRQDIRQPFSLTRRDVLLIKK